MLGFIEDGHKIVFTLEGDDLSITRIICPHDGGAKGTCNASRSFCVVRKFISLYGIEGCVGSTVIDGPVEIAWIGREGESELDDQYGMIYFTPINDQSYREAKDDAELEALAGEAAIV